MTHGQRVQKTRKQVINSSEAEAPAVLEGLPAKKPVAKRPAVKVAKKKPATKKKTASKKKPAAK